MSLVEVSWEELWREGDSLARHLQPLVQRDIRQLWIPALDIHAGLALFAAALHLGLDPLFDEKAKQPPSVSSVLLVAPPHFYTQALDPQPGLKLAGAPPTSWFGAMAKRTVWFSSSGSTAVAKPIDRNMLGLNREAKALRNLHQVPENGVVVSLVRPFHIYGFLHALVVPLLADATVVFWPHLQALPEAAAGFPESIDLLVMVPAHWRLSQYIFDLAQVTGVVTSGAAFGPERGRELQALERRPKRCVEILGSTETGGIGHRQVGHSREEDSTLFTLFDGIVVEPSDGATVVHSPFLAPELNVCTADQLEPVGHQQFRYLGRSDRVFKYAGVRYSLNEIEAAISSHCQGTAVVCTFTPDAQVAQGGVLAAWIEAASVDMPKLREALAATTRLPCPQLVHAVAELPRDSQGKVALGALKALPRNG